MQGTFLLCSLIALCTDHFGMVCALKKVRIAHLKLISNQRFETFAVRFQ